jgi:hypothetical protein
VDGVMSVLVRYTTKPEDLPKAIAFTVNAIAEITAKYYHTLFRIISLLKLISKIQDACPRLSSRFRVRHRGAIAEGKLPVYQGYLFAVNLACPDFLPSFMK